MYRAYPNFGYVTDNRNFGYDTASMSRLKVGDLLLSKTGSVFYSQLSDSPKKIEDIMNISGIKEAAFNKIKENICV